MNTTDKRRTFIINIFYFAMVAAIVLLLFKYVVPWLLPFLIGYGISLLFRPVVRSLTKHTKLNKKIVGCFVLVFGYGIIVLLLTFLGSRAITSISRGVRNLPVLYSTSIQPGLMALNSSINTLLIKLSPELVADINQLFAAILSSLQAYLVTLSSGALTWLAALTTGIPSFLLGFIFTIMSSFIITMNYQEVTTFLAKQIPDKYLKMVFEIKGYFVGTLFKYFRAYLIIVSLTFLELSIGLSVLSVKNAIFIALCIAIFDVLPVLGTGGIVIPWAVIEFAKQNVSLGVGLLFLYGIVTVIRNILEPKIVGDQLGLNPLVTLAAIYIGFKTIGVSGMILFPITVQILVSLHKDGYIHLWNAD